MTYTSSNIGEYAPSSSMIHGKNNDPYLEYNINHSHLLLGKHALRHLRENPNFWVPTYLDVSELVLPAERPEFPSDFESYKETEAGEFFLHYTEEAALWYINDELAYVRIMSHFLKGNGKTEQLGMAVAGSFDKCRRGLMIFDRTDAERLDEITTLVDDHKPTLAEGRFAGSVLVDFPMKKTIAALVDTEPTPQAS